jgi:membrane-bound lytic murein transglycosylase D
MQSSALRATSAVCALTLLSSACAKQVATNPADLSPEPPPLIAAEPIAGALRPQAAPLLDPVVQLLELSTRHFELGQFEMQLGHLDMARAEFNRALEVLLESPNGGRTEPRIREHFDRLVERISTYEISALAQGDGFTERRFDPATIDEILAVSTTDVPDATAKTAEVVAADLKQISHDIDIPLNARVLSFVELLTGRLKGFLEQGLSNSVRYLPMIQDVFRAEGLPLDLAYVPLIESAFKPSALSRARARGIWQFMVGTGIENGLKTDWYIDERADPEKATVAAARYLKTLHRMFDGDWHLALASYNGGPGRVQRAMKRSGRDDFWQLSASTRYLPRETRDYVPLILAAIIIARNPAQYGMSIAPAEAPRIERLTLANAVDLRRIAEWLGVPVQAIQDLNPELRRWTTPVRATDYELKLPAGTVDIVRQQLEGNDPTQLAPLNWHVVKRGETLLSIARALKVNRTDLAEANYLSTRARVTVGQRLIIPRAPTILLAANVDNPAPLGDATSLVASASATNATGLAAGTGLERDTAPTQVVHHVKRGDTLFSIARVYSTTVAAIKSWNRLRSNAIQIGQRLTIFPQQTAAE